MHDQRVGQPFEVFLANRHADLRRIASRTHGEYSSDDLAAEAWLLAIEIGQKRGWPFNFLDGDDQDTLFAWLHNRFVKYAEKAVRYAVRLDRDWDSEDSEQTGSALARLLTAPLDTDPQIRQQAIDEQGDLVAAVMRSYSEATAYVLLLIRVDWHLEDLRKIPIATARTGLATAFEASVDGLATQADDSPPLKYNNTFIAGAHGASIVKRVTATAHGKAVGDIGSQWTSPGGVNFWIIAIPDANTLWFLSANTSGDSGKWAFNTTLAASGTMTYVTGGVNTSNISYSAQATQQLLPCVQDHSIVIKRNGAGAVSATGVYDSNYVRVEESYGVANPVSVLAYVIAGRPWAVAPELNHTSIDTQVLCEYAYEIHDNGSVSVAGRFENLTTLNLSTNIGYAGFIQANPIGWASGGGVENLNLYTLRINSIVGGVKTWNFEAGEVISGTVEALEFTSATWKEPSNPPDRVVYFVKTTATGIRSRGFALGYSRISGAGAALSSYINNSASFSTARKVYPKIITDQALGSASGTLPANTVVAGTAYRIPYNLASTPELTTNAVRLFQGGAEIALDVHQNLTAYAVPVPAKLNGKAVTIVNGNGNLTLDSAVVTAGAITISVTGSYGAAVLQVG